MSTKPTVVLVPGAWHTPKSFALMTANLEAAGYTVQGVDLPSVGAETPLEGFEPDVQAIRAVIEAAADAEQDVLVFMHSYGSVPAGEAVKGLDKMARRKEGKQGGVAHLFYCSAFALKKGGSLIGDLGGKPLPWFRISSDEQIVDPDNPAEIFYADVADEQKKLAISDLKSHSYRTMFSKATWEPFRDIPSTYLFCEDDQAIPLPVQQGMVEGTKGVQWKTETLKTSHSPYLSEPEKVARMVRKAAGETI